MAASGPGLLGVSKCMGHDDRVENAQICESFLGRIITQRWRRSFAWSERPQTDIGEGITKAPALIHVFLNYYVAIPGKGADGAKAADNLSYC